MLLREARSLGVEKRLGEMLSGSANRIRLQLERETRHMVAVR